MYKSSIKSRLRAFVEHLGMDKLEFQNSIGASGGYLNRESEPNGTVIANVLRTYPQLSPDWLLTGFGPMLRHSVTTQMSHPSLPPTASTMQ